ncbi:MAG: hypothetical protein V3T88_06240 [Nitrosomonadaceae bacterium]
MTTSSYPIVSTEDDILRVLQEIVRLREAEDISDFNNLEQRFLAGRKANRVPSSNSDVIAGDNIGDVVNDATFQYKLLDISGVLKWDRRALDTAW